MNNNNNSNVNGKMTVESEKPKCLFQRLTVGLGYLVFCFFFYFLNLLPCVGIELINNVVVVSGEQ